ncbi:MAG: serine hydrolase [Saprospiraceae bacterium]|nr:serine hydrolase [Saprospiraceae bacterium]
MKYPYLALSILYFLFFSLQPHLTGQYFPPASDIAWEKVDPQALGWDKTSLDELRDYLEEAHTKAFVIIKDGKIAVEWYLNGHARTTPWYWASAGKTLTAGLVGIAAQEGKLQLTDPTSKYLGRWTSCSLEDESKIQIIHQLTMTSGLNEFLGFDCLEPACLKCLAMPGTRWTYHNGPYTLLDGVIENATGKNLTEYFRSRIGDKIDMQGTFISLNNVNVFYSTALDAARYGYLLLNQGKWKGSVIINEPFVYDLSHPSQQLNQSYGLLTWLNGQASHKLPGEVGTFQGPIIPEGPDDLYAALGKNDQKIHVVPSLNLVLIRFGDAAITGSEEYVPVNLDNEIWKHLNRAFGTNTGTLEINNKLESSTGESSVIVRKMDKSSSNQLFDVSGRMINYSYGSHFEAFGLTPGIYFFRGIKENKRVVEKLLVY